MIKKSPIKEPFYYDRKEGIDHFTKILVEENPKKLSDKEKQDIHKLGQDMKRDALNRHAKEVKQFKNDDPSTYLSDPKVRGQLLEIDKLEKDLAPKLADLPIVRNNINRPVKRNYWDDTMKLNVGNKGPIKLPKLTPEEIKRANEPSTWDVIYGSMSPFQKGTWNSEQRNKKLRQKKEEAEDKAAEELTPAKMASEVIEHVIPSSSVVPEQKSNDYYPGAVSAEDSISNMTVDHAIRPKRHESGLNENFVKEKMAEAKMIKDVLGE